MNGVKGYLAPKEFGDLFGMYDVACISETKCDDVDMTNVASSMENLGFDNVSKNRYELCRYKSGGLMIAVRMDIRLSWKTIKNKNKALILMNQITIGV